MFLLWILSGYGMFLLMYMLCFYGVLNGTSKNKTHVAIRVFIEIYKYSNHIFMIRSTMGVMPLFLKFGKKIASVASNSQEKAQSNTCQIIINSLYNQIKSKKYQLMHFCIISDIYDSSITKPLIYFLFFVFFCSCFDIITHMIISRV